MDSIGQALVETVKELGYTYQPLFTWPAMALIAVALLAAAWACVRYRWRRRGDNEWLCPRCCYDLRGLVETGGFPLTCSECAMEIASKRVQRRTRVAWRWVAMALVLLVAAHFAAKGPEIGRGQWIRVVPSTVMVLAPMNVTTWTDTRWNLSDEPVDRRTWHEDLTRRLVGDRLWDWQEWIFFKRVEYVLRSRGDYGLTETQYEMAVRMATMRADAEHDEPLRRRLVRLAESADVPFTIDWESLEEYGWVDDFEVFPAAPNATVIEALNELYLMPFAGREVCWDITPDGLVVAGPDRELATARVRIYDLRDLPRDEWCVCPGSPGRREEVDLVTATIDPAGWVENGGSASGMFAIADRLVVMAPTRVHLQIEDMLAGVRAARLAEPLVVQWEPLIDNPRAFHLADGPTFGLLDHLRLSTVIPPKTLDTDPEAAPRDMYGLLDGVRDLR